MGHPSLTKQFVGSAAFPWWHFPAMVTRPVPSTTPPTNCRQESPIHPIQNWGNAVRAVHFRSFHLSNPPLPLCSYCIQVPPGCPQLSSLLASHCHHFVLSNACSKKIFLCFLWLNLGTASLLWLQNYFCRGDFGFSSL